MIDRNRVVVTAFLWWSARTIPVNSFQPTSPATQIYGVFAETASLCHNPTAASSIITRLFMSYPSQGRSSSRGGSKDRSKRQERVGHLLRSELSTILHRGDIKGHADYLEADLRKRISIINADVSPDLRQARITVSIRKSGPGEGTLASEDGGVASSAAVERRRAYSWLVQNTKAIRHSLAQRLSHMKSVPNLSFAQADVSAAVDVMYLIDKISSGSGYKRDSIGSYGGDDDSLPRGMVQGIDFDEDFDDEDWVDEDEDFFSDHEETGNVGRKGNA